MYLSNPVVTLLYESGRGYTASYEESSDKIRLFWEDWKLGDSEEGEHQCFTTFENPTDSRPPSDEEAKETIAEKANRLIVARRLEDEGTMNRKMEHHI